MSDKPNKRNSDRLFYTVAIGTVLYFVAGFMLFQKYINPGEYLEYYKWNALGDFLAGVFAPLAFAWLVAAVITQREELQDSRKQYLSSQDVIKKQMDSIQQQNVMLVEQHNLAKETAKKTYRLSLFEPRFAIYQELIRYSERHSAGAFDVESHKEIVRIKDKSAFVFGHDISTWLEEVANDVDGILERESMNLLMDNMMSNEKGMKVLQERYENDKKQNDKYIQKRTMLVLNEMHSENIMEKLWPYLYISDKQ